MGGVYGAAGVFKGVEGSLGDEEVGLCMPLLCALSAGRVETTYLNPGFEGARELRHPALVVFVLIGGDCV